MHKWQREREAAAVPLLALHPDPPVVPFHNLLADREAQPEMCAMLRALMLQAVEAAKDLMQLILRDPHACILHVDPHFVLKYLGRDRDRAARRRGLHGVLHQIRDHLADPLAIHKQLGDIVGHQRAHREPELLRRHQEARVGGEHQVDEVRPLRQQA